MIKSRKLLILELLIISIISFVISLSLFGVQTVNANNAFHVENGASIRITTTEDATNKDNYGIRFKANVGTPVEGASYRIMIIPSTYVDAYNAAKGSSEEFPSIAEWLLEKQQNNPDMPLAITRKLIPDSDGIIYGNIITIKYANLNTKFAGVAYYTLGEDTADTQDDQIVTATMASDGQRSIVDIATKALEMGYYEPTEDDTEDEVEIKNQAKAVIKDFVKSGIKQGANKLESEDAVITLDQSSVGNKIGDEINLSYQPAIATSLATWTTSDSSVATVSNGKITCVGTGTAVITLNVVDVTATCTVVVAPEKLDVLSDIKTGYKVLDGISGLSNVSYKINDAEVSTETYAFDKATSYTVTASCTYNEKDFAIDVPVAVTDLSKVDFAAQEEYGMIGRFGGESRVTAGTYQERDAVLLEGNAYLNKELINAIREAGFWTLTFDAYVTSLVESSADKTFSMQGYMPGGNIHNCSTSQEYSVGHLTISYADISEADTGRWITFYLDISRFYDDEYILMLTTCLSSVVISNMNFHYVPQFTATDTEISNEEMQTYGRYILIPTFRGAVAGAALSWVEGGYRNNRPVDPNGFHFQNSFTLLRGYLVQANSFGKNMMNLNLQGMGSTAIGAWTPEWDGNPWGSREDIGWAKTTKSIDLTYAMQNKTPDGNTLNPYALYCQDRLDYVLTLNAYNVCIQLDSFSFTEVGAN